jgi:hypothetical protein
VDFRLGEGAADAEDHAFAIVATNPVGDESGTIADDPVDADFVVGGINGHVADRRQGAVAPFSEFGIELLVEIGDLAGGDLEAAEFLHDFGDSAGADALDIHGGDGGFEGAITARTLFQQRCGKDPVAFTNLGNGKFQGSDSGLEHAGLEAVGVAISLDSALVGSGSDVVFAFEHHGGVH